MQLKQIGFGDPEKNDQPFIDCYREFMQADIESIPEDGTVARERLAHHAQHIIDLLQVLEDEYDGPPKWLCTSHYDIVLYVQNIESTEQVTENTPSVVVRSHEYEDGQRRYLIYENEIPVEAYDTRDAASALVAVLVNVI